MISSSEILGIQFMFSWSNSESARIPRKGMELDDIYRVWKFLSSKQVVHTQSSDGDVHEHTLELVIIKSPR